MIPIARPLRPLRPQRILVQAHSPSSSRLLSSSRHAYSHGHGGSPHHHLSRVDDHEIVQLANKTQHPLSLADLVKHGRPPLSEKSLLSSANFTLSLLPIRLAHRIQALRNLPYIVVSNPNISRIYNNYVHSLSTLLPWWSKGGDSAVRTLDDEIRFTEVLAELVATHTDTIPILARGFLECRRYISPQEVTRFLDEHLRARIGTRLVAEQHIALHYSSQPHFDPGASPTPCPEHPSYIGVIDTALRPAQIIESCAGFVADICELRYGLRPQLYIDGEPDTTFAFIPMHLEYIVTELLKNAFRATVEHRDNKEPIVVTIAPEPPRPNQPLNIEVPKETRGEFRSDAIKPLDDNVPGVTIRIRDRGGGIAPEVLPNIWSYSFTTFSDEDEFPGSDNGLNVISSASAGGSSIAGLGYGLPLSRAYAEYFGGGIAVQSLHGWGTDVYLRLNGVGKIQERRTT
ncbi:[3-methyl-2-oxobutanoate dehydrogenase [lipoamide]] kinase, mitochondrial [Colletotrichum liriopes]|uniref:Protein-serine/threonine kinase n=1 Tax=Colletotrichum liriopes TaxID=708192 RepID=A0AA37LMD5_9PEZI|nr:[3-methyl-2-oxobutanoate dehydrogenase [lipoamide]] kinase, mitochondrial [Colletotrichum liriopes]